MCPRIFCLQVYGCVPQDFIPAGIWLCAPGFYPCRYMVLCPRILSLQVYGCVPQDSLSAGISLCAPEFSLCRYIVVRPRVPSPTCGLLLGRSEVLRCLRHYLPVQSQGHHIIDSLEETDVERGSARRISLKERERAIVNQTNIGTVSKGALGKLLRDGVERVWAFPNG